MTGNTMANQESDNWPIISQRQAWGEFPGSRNTLGLSLRCTEKLDEECQMLARRALDDLWNKIEEQWRKTDPEVIKAGLEEADDLLACFHRAGIKPIYSEPTDNEYWGPAWNVRNPWLVVTTPFGRVKIGWRKRVIEITWDAKALNVLAKNLFPDEDVTKDNTTIHAWSYDKATEYLKQLAAWDSARLAGVKNAQA